ncbi:hypothetical protein NKDENANG_03941 [Candidatus Entotheonellaceae bacterium PAL068K]
MTPRRNPAARRLSSLPAGLCNPKPRQGFTQSPVPGCRSFADATSRTARAYARRHYTFTLGSTPATVVEQSSGEVWQAQEESLINDRNGERLPRPGGHMSYWFGWYAF